MKTSATIKGLSDALAKALAVIQNPSKDSINPHFRNKYASLDTGLNVVREALSKNGVSFAQTTRMEGDMMMLDTRLMFGDEWIEGEYPVIRFPAKQQEIGSALTYARRYSLFAICGIAGEEDDDANAATSATPAPNFSTLVAAMKKSLSECDTPVMLDAWHSANIQKVSKFGQADKEELKSLYLAKKSELTLPEAAE